MMTGKMQRESIYASAHLYTSKSLFELIQTFNQLKGDILAQRVGEAQKDLYEVKKNIALASKKNFTLERDIRNLDKKIALLVKNRLSLEEVMAQSGDISLINKNIAFKDQNRRRVYGKLFYLLQTDTRYIARLAEFVKIGEIDNLLQTVMFTLYGNQYDEYEEHLLLSMFQKVLEVEFQSNKSISGVLRANTAISRMMTTYTRRSPGQQYLKQTLCKCLNDIINNDSLQLEVNPLKVYEQMINDYEAKTGQLSKLNRKASAEEAAENVDVKRLLQTRFDQLGRLTDEFISDLISSLALVPYGIRWICKQIKSLVKVYFPDSTRENICSMIGGFFLLRFINPAIVTPQAFMLVDSKLSAVARRNLTLVAKIMQNLANNVQFGGVKELYMGPLNAVLERNRDKLNAFLSDLTNVADLSDHLNMDRYIAMGKTEVPTINISLNELYFIHALLKDHQEEIVLANEDNKEMTKVLEELGPAPPQLLRKDNANIDLELDKSVKSSDDSSSHSSDQVYAETKYLLLIVLKSIPPFTTTPAITIDDLLSRALAYARESANPSLFDHVERLRENCKYLVRDGFLRPDDDYSSLRKDTVLELMNHEDMIEKTKSDLDRLKGVLNNIQDHHNFLTEQFDAFKEYLNNVRQKSNVTSRKADKEDKKKEKKVKAKGPFKYTHNALMKDGVISESSVPEDRRSSIFFVFSSSSPGVFDVVVMFGRRQIAKLTIQLDDLLEKQQNNELIYETEFLKLSVNLLIFTLNRDFMS